MKKIIFLSMFFSFMAIAQAQETVDVKTKNDSLFIKVHTKNEWIKNGKISIYFIGGRYEERPIWQKETISFDETKKIALIVVEGSKIKNFTPPFGRRREVRFKKLIFI